MSDPLKQGLQAARRRSSAWKGVEWLGIREVREVKTTRSFRNAKPDLNCVQESHGIMLEVLVDGVFGYAAITGNDPERILMAAESAYLQAVPDCALHPGAAAIPATQI